ncbi:MAG TPA: acyloxyacyl hydrolase [Terracidiphilus sp.]|jgi:opacity protein-like surface antigen|nr:acyloxyacyl hydrolase [Terracidiphilus sp.]
MEARVLLFKSGVPCPGAVSQVRPVLLFVALFLIASTALAQSSDANPFFARKNTFSVFGAYSNDSSHILLGYAENRKLLDFGAGYSRRLFVNHVVDWQYSGEILPVALESDVLGQQVDHQTQPTVGTSPPEPVGQVISCAVATTPYSFTIPNPNGSGTTTYSGTLVQTCSGREWNIGEAISPIGLQWNFLPRLKMQPFFIGHGGYMYTTKAIPILFAGSFNFTFDVGAGIELYRSKTRSIRAEYRYHHISNHGTAEENPGIDNGLFQVTYSFGR